MEARLLIAIVLYRCRAEESKALSSLKNIVETAENPIKIVVVNNTKEVEVSPSSSYSVCYTDENLCLAEPYNFAVTLAEESGASHIMFLDQDTSVTKEFIEEVIEKTVVSSEEIASFVPTLRNARSHLSPGHYDVSKGLYLSMEDGVGDYSEKRLLTFAFNSASVMNVKILRSIGGFPLNYPLDMLDHAIYRKFFLAGYRVEALSSTLVHDLSIHSDEGMPKNRAERYLDFVEQYYAEEAALADRYKEIVGCSIDITVESNYRKYLLKAAIKTAIKRLVGRQSGFPTAGMYFKRYRKSSFHRKIEGFNPFENYIKDESSQYTNIHNIEY